MFHVSEDVLLFDPDGDVGLDADTDPGPCGSSLLQPAAPPQTATSAQTPVRRAPSRRSAARPAVDFAVVFRIRERLMGAFLMEAASSSRMS
jgi:hypothetical protein